MDVFYDVARPAPDRKSDENLYPPMCIECGELITFDLQASETSVLSRNGHQIRNDFPARLSPTAMAELNFCDLCGKPLGAVKRFRRPGDAPDIQDADLQNRF